MKSLPFFSAGIICMVLGLFAWTAFIQDIISGNNVDLLNFETILFPIGIALVRPGKFWEWVARIQLFVLALFSGFVLIGSLIMTDETKFLVFEFDRTEMFLTSTGMILLLHGLFLAAIVWVNFSIFAHRKKISGTIETPKNSASTS